MFNTNKNSKQYRIIYTRFVNEYLLLLKIINCSCMHCCSAVKILFLVTFGALYCSCIFGLNSRSNNPDASLCSSSLSTIHLYDGKRGMDSKNRYSKRRNIKIFLIVILILGACFDIEILTPKYQNYILASWCTARKFMIIILDFMSIIKQYNVIRIR